MAGLASGTSECMAACYFHAMHFKLGGAGALSTCVFALYQLWRSGLIFIRRNTRSPNAIGPDNGISGPRYADAQHITRWFGNTACIRDSRLARCSSRADGGTTDRVVKDDGVIWSPTSPPGCYGHILDVVCLTRRDTYQRTRYDRHETYGTRAIKTTPKWPSKAPAGT